MRKFTTALGLAAVLAAGAASVVTMTPFTPAADQDVHMIGCSDTDTPKGALSFAESGGVESGYLQKRHCPRTKGQKGSIASV
ncbi:hypothetical protein EOI86_09870 [Hwanghaeella grinnelliae]|uniref:Secreted protein n=1 Tax=Hwanghaeella grinnelliae TaxID=2500179 RepID=A0A3S2W832_9PROT|nr:hypothetical protein [Hwanghaeella grinnelliae]RVU39513.1 hypothetical protein EOI86_09870 [Hwanghaeella grinnelliae]